MTTDSPNRSSSGEPDAPAVVQMLPHEIDALTRSVAGVPDGACGLDREAALYVLEQLKAVKLERDAFLAELVEAGLG